MDDLLNKLLLLDNNLTAEEILVRNTVREYANNIIIPKICDHYEQASCPVDLVQQLASLGLFGMTLPQEYGGSEASSVAYGLACQELERADSAVRSFVSVQSSLCMYPIYAYGSSDQKAKYLVPMSKGEVIGCFGLTEPGSGSDPASMQTTATKVKDGWLLNGSKLWITNATIADLGIVWAKIDNVANHEIRGFLVDLKSAKSANSQTSQKSGGVLIATEIKNKMSLRASVTGELSFSDLWLPEDSLLPGSTKGLAAALGCLTQARYGIAWGAMGAAMHCFEQAIEYTKNRVQFNRPIASNQLIQKQLVDIYTELCKAAVFNIHLGRLKDQNQADYVLVSMAKMNSCREALKIARTCRNILGANGITLEYHIIRHMNNLESVFTYEGTDNIHTLAIGRYVTGISAF